MKVHDKVVVVTGAGSGVGRELALQLLRRGARVAAVDVRADTLTETADLAAAAERLSTHQVDITDALAVSTLPQDVISLHGAVDGLINNAGIMQPMLTVDELDLATIRRLLDVNLMGTIHMVKAFLTHLEARPEAHIANVASMGAYLPVPGQTAYGASKAAVKLLTEGLYAELLDTAVGVSVVFPGKVATNIAANSGVTIEGASAAARRMCLTSAADAAHTILDGIEADRLHVYVGRDAWLLSLAVRVAPKKATHLIRRQMGHLLTHARS